MRPPTTWVLVADGSRARIVRDIGQQAREPFIAQADTPRTDEDLVFDSEHRPLRDAISDKPRRSFAFEVTRRSAMACHSNPVRNREKEFAATLVGNLEKCWQAGEFDRFVIVAPPRMLVTIRQASPDELRGLVTGEIASDYTKLARKNLLEAIASSDIVGLVLTSIKERRACPR